MNFQKVKLAYFPLRRCNLLHAESPVTFADTGGAAFLLCGAKAVLTSKKDSVCKAFPAFDAPGEGGGTHPDCPQRFFAPLRGNKCTGKEAAGSSAARRRGMGEEG